jgi:hypothetical protein
VEPARFAELFDRHYPAVLRYLRRRIGPDLADDLAAETFTWRSGGAASIAPSIPTLPPPHVVPRWPWPTCRPSSARCCCRVLDLDGTRGGQ